MEPFLIKVDEQLKEDHRSKIRQHEAALFATLSAVCAGAAMGWTSPALPLLQGETNTTLALLVTEEEGSWIGSLLPIGALVGAMPSGFLANIIGRRTFLLTVTIPYLLGWLFIIFASDSVSLVYIGRFVTGLGVGATTVVVPLYNEEIAEDSVRGALGVYLDLMICVGILWIYLVGTWLPYLWISVVSCALPLVFCLSFYWMPESPVYLVSKGYIAKARDSLAWLQNGGDTYDVQPVLQQIVIAFRESSQNKESHPMKSVIQDLISNFSLLSPSICALKIIFGLMFFQQMSGINAIIFYTVQIFIDTGSLLPGSIATIIIGVVQVIATFASSIIVDQVGRRPLLLLSSSIMSICLALVSIYFIMMDSGFNINCWGWLPVISLTVYIVAFSIGFGPLPWLMMAELLPLNVKGWASAVSSFFNGTMMFIVTKEFPIMISYLGSAVTYGVFSFICAVSIVFVMFMVPETKGKSREEIQQGLDRRHKARNRRS